MFLTRLTGFYIKSLGIYLGNLGINFDVYNYCCANFVVKILLYVYKAMCSLVLPKIVLKIILDALFEFRSKDKYERKMLNILKTNFKEKLYK